MLQNNNVGHGDFNSLREKERERDRKKMANEKNTHTRKNNNKVQTHAELFLFLHFFLQSYGKKGQLNKSHTLMVYFIKMLCTYERKKIKKKTFFFERETKRNNNSRHQPSKIKKKRYNVNADENCRTVKKNERRRTTKNKRMKQKFQIE